jgi:predicted solute-binding protein
MPFRVLLLGALSAVVSGSSACTPTCQAVQHIGNSGAVDTVAVAATGQTCTVNVYSSTALDSVGPKPKK